MVDGAEELSRINGPQLAQLYAREALLDLERRQRQRTARPILQYYDWCVTALKNGVPNVRAGSMPALHHRLMIDELQGVANGETKRLMIAAPPGSAKSTYSTELFPPYLWERFPGFQVLGASHTSSLADDFSGKIQLIVKENSDTLHYGLRTESKQRWYTTNGGAYLSAGVGGGIPGFRANCALVDDPVRTPADADSPAIQKRNWDWFNWALESRCTPGAPIILISTRWNENDLAGMLLQTEAHKWRILVLKAEAEDEDDPLGRVPGEFLWGDDDYGYGSSLREIRDTLESRGSTREWAALYQQHPNPPEGILFQVWQILKRLDKPIGGSFCRAWDLAATTKTESRDPDWTRGVLLHRSDDRLPKYTICDVAGVRGTPDQVENLIKNTARADGPEVVIGLPQDPGQAGKVLALYDTRMLEGYTLRISPESGDKEKRAGPVASQCNGGNLLMVEGPWNSAFISEMASFPAGAHDDQVDALSRAFSELALGPREFSIEPSVLQGLRLGTLMPRIQRRSVRI